MSVNDVSPMRRAIVLAAVLAAVLTGCTAEDAIQGATAQERAGHANDMLANPPWANVAPTGRVVDVTLYLHRMDNHELYPGAVMSMWGFSTSDDPSTATVPGPEIRVTEGDTLRVTLVATFDGFNHTLHFHGQHVPFAMDGVPYASQEPVQPGEPFTYEFVASPAGTYWYHCHVDAQHHIDMGMYGVLIVEPQDAAQDPRFDVEFTLVMDEMDRYHNEGGLPSGTNMPQSLDPFSYEEWLRRQGSDAVNRNTAVQDGLSQTGAQPQRSEEYGYPITHAPYTATYQTYLINGYAFPYTEPLIVNDGQIARLRLVNAGNEAFAMHLHGHHVLVTHKDGILLESPYWADVVPLLPGERYDVYVKLDNPGMWDLHDHVGGHTQNDYVFPGGAMTMLCYASYEGCSVGGGHDHGGYYPSRSGDLLRWTGHDLP